MSSKMTKKVYLLIVLTLLVGMVGKAKADFVFGTPTNLGPTVNSWRSDDAANISPDGLTLFLTSNRSGGSGGSDLWVSTRAIIDDPWSEAVNLGTTVNSSTYDGCASISADGLTLYFSAYNRPGGQGGSEIWMTARATTEDDWSTPVNLDVPVYSGKHEWSQSISADGLTFYFGSRRSGGSGDFDLWVTTRATIDDDWSTSVNLGATVNSSAEDFAPSISADGNTLFFELGRPSGLGDSDIWMTKRNTAEGDWTTPVNLGPEVNTSYDEFAPSISADGSTLYFCSNRPGGLGDYDLWQVPIEPVVDFDGDGVVDGVDINIMVDFWGADESLCDIGPTPFGDGVVDVQDLIILVEYIVEARADVNDVDDIE